jgi:eukaryotic-like serine/threonine-protein kinase
MLVGKKIGPFVVDKELGSGAMGAVYRGRHADTGDKVAIKVVAPGLATNANALKRFKRETSILKQLAHPNIVKLIASGKMHGTPFYVMEFVEGESLDHVMERRGRITWEELIPLGQQLCAALQHAHDQGIIHRDLKPANLMMLKDGTVKLADFGIAKDIDVTALTAANSTVGTCAYMSPEQCRGSVEVTPKSDLYSMGVMFFELLTGRKPFLAETVMEMFMQHTQGKFPRPSKLMMEIPIWLDELICQLLEKEPNDRPFSADKVAEALGSVKEKWEKQQSAAVTAVRKRRADRTSRDTSLNDTEKELGRTLLGKKKKKGEPFYRRAWFTISAVAAVLLAVGTVIYFFAIKLPSPESLLAEAEQVMTSKDIEDWRSAREDDGPIGRFLRYYPSHPDAKKVRGWSDQILLRDRELQMTNRRNNKLAAMGEEKAARMALDDEDSGKLDDARGYWKGLLAHEDSPNVDLRSWGLVAKKHLDEIHAVEELQGKLKYRIGKEKEGKGYASSDSDMEKRALEAIRLEDQKKYDDARLKWKDLKDDAGRQDDQRLWYLLAAKCLRDAEARKSG